MLAGKAPKFASDSPEFWEATRKPVARPIAE